MAKICALYGENLCITSGENLCTLYYRSHLSIGKIVELYNDSVKTGIPLSFLCDITSDNEFFDESDDEMLEQEFEDEWEAHQQYLEDNMSLAESWQYYNDDDAEDPYACIEEPEEYYY